MRLRFNEREPVVPIDIAELQFFVAAEPVAVDSAGLAGLVNRLAALKVNAVYCDRGLAAALLRDGPENIMLSLDGDVFPKEHRRLPSDVMRLKAQTVIIEGQADALFCSNVLHKVGVDYRSERVGGWQLFVIESEPDTAVKGRVPLRWMGFAPMIDDAGGVWCKSGRHNVSNKLESGNVKSGVLVPKNSLNVIFKNGLELLGVDIQKRGVESLQYTCHWRVPDDNFGISDYAVFVHLLDKDDNIVAQDDHILNDVGVMCMDTGSNRFMETRVVKLPSESAVTAVKMGIYQATPPFKRIKIKKAATKSHGRKHVMISL
jgi:hypothetical protein